MQAVTRRVWWPKGGDRPLAEHRTRYEWEYVSGFFRPEDGASELFLFPTVSNEITSLALAEFAEARKLAETDTVAIVVMDGAGFHSEKSLAVPENVRIVRLPPYSPQLQPAECAWPLLREPVANRNFPSLAALTETLSERCRWLMGHPEILVGHVGFDWIQRITKQEIFT